MTEFLRITGLTITTGGQTLVDDVSWSLGAGQRLGIIGESGSGKSLTALAILGLLPDGLTATGSIRFQGTEIVGAPERQLRKVRGVGIAMVSQEPLTALDPLMRVGSQVSGPIELHRGLKRASALEEVRGLLDSVGLRDTERVADSFPWQLSGGQRQRVALAMALACGPQLLIADEPTTALDVTVQARILRLLEEKLSAQGTALIFVSHDLPVVASLTKDIAIMRRGRVVETTTVDDALAGAEHPYTRELIAAARASQVYGPRLTREPHWETNELGTP